MEERIKELENTVANLEKQVAALTATAFDPRKAAEVMVKASDGKKAKRGISIYS